MKKICVMGAYTVLLTAFLKASVAAYGTQIIEINGSLLAQDYSLQNTKTIVTNFSTTFTISVSGSRWLIRSDYGSNYYSAFGCDGTNVVSFLVEKKKIFLRFLATLYLDYIHRLRRGMSLYLGLFMDLTNG